MPKKKTAAHLLCLCKVATVPAHPCSKTHSCACICLCVSVHLFLYLTCLFSSDLSGLHLTFLCDGVDERAEVPHLPSFRFFFNLTLYCDFSCQVHARCLNLKAHAPFSFFCVLLFTTYTHSMHLFSSNFTRFFFSFLFRTSHDHERKRTPKPRRTRAIFFASAFSFALLSTPARFLPSMCPPHFVSTVCDSFFVLFRMCLESPPRDLFVFSVFRTRLVFSLVPYSFPFSFFFALRSRARHVETADVFPHEDGQDVNSHTRARMLMHTPSAFV